MRYQLFIREESKVIGHSHRWAVPSFRRIDAAKANSRSAETQITSALSPTVVHARLPRAR